MTPLHIHTDYSLLKSPLKLKELIKRAKELGYKALGITELFNLFGAIEFYQLAEKEGIKPIIGTEVAIDRDGEIHRLLLYAQNYQGYRNLLYLSSISYLHHYKEIPTIPLEILKGHREGVIAILPMLTGEVGFHLNLFNEENIVRGAGGYPKAREALERYREILPHLYLEIRRDRKEESYIEEEIKLLSREVGVPLVAQSSIYYLEPYQIVYKDALECIGENWQFDDLHRPVDVGEYHLRTPEEYEKLFSDLPEAVENSDKIAQMVDVELVLNQPTPPSFKFTKEYAQREGLEFESDVEYFEYKCWEGLEERLKNIPPELHDQYRERLKYEIEIIKKMKFPGYMLIVWDFINYAKDPSRHLEKYRKKYGNKPIPVGPGRGSAAGSLVTYALKITNIDPIRWGLLFERFLNPERVSLPDIDVDFCQERREEVLEYVRHQYGKNNVSQVITFQSLLARGVLRDLARIFGVDYSTADKFVKLVPEGPKVKLKDALEQEPKISQKMEEDPLYDRLFRFGLALEGVKRGTGTHAAGVVISDTPLWEKSPLYKLDPAEEMPITQYSLNYLEAVDLIKFDFLGLKNLTIIQKALDFIADETGESIDLDNLDLTDPEVYKLIQSGKTLGLFQIESDGMQDLARRLKPSTFDDIIAMLALYRPGPMDAGMLDSYINRKHGREPVSYFFPEFEKALKPILEPTYGVIVYQEQVMQIVQAIAGFSLGEADIIRRAMGKKKKDLMKKYSEEFARRAQEQGYSYEHAKKLFESIEKFAGYGFNKSHSAAYAMVTYQTAYLKTHYPTQFFSALLTYEADNTDKVAKYIEEAKNLGIEVLPPDVNRSKGEFTPRDGKILFGLNAIKGVGSKAVESILKGQPFGDLTDFLLKIDSKVNRKVLEQLIKAGALDSFGYTRRTLFENIDKMLEFKRQIEEKRHALTAKTSLFSVFGEEEVANEIGGKIELENLPEWDTKTLLENEYASLGFYVSAHPLDPFKEELKELEYNLSSEKEELIKSEALFVGKVDKLKKKVGKSGKKFGILTLLDYHGKLDIFLFSRDLEKLEQMDLERPIAIKAEVDKDGERWRITGRKVLTLEEAKGEKKGTRQRILELTYRIGEEYEADLRAIRRQIEGMAEGEQRIAKDKIETGNPLGDCSGDFDQLLEIPLLHPTDK